MTFKLRIAFFIFELAWLLCGSGYSAGLVVPACRVSVPDGGGVYSKGSGVLIGESDDKAWVLTNWHVVRDGSGQCSVTFGGETVPGRVLKTDNVADLALIECEAIGVDPVEFAPMYPTKGDIVIAGGFGPDDQWRAVEGPVSGYYSPDQGRTKDTLAMRGSVRQGDSGGPIVDEQGRLVAVLWGTDGSEVMGTQVGRIMAVCQAFGCAPCQSGSCGRGWCPAPYAQPRQQRPQIISRPQAVPRAPQQSVPSIPNAVPQSPAKGCECDPTLGKRITELEAKIAAAEASIESGQFAGKPGRDGVDGKDGKDGATPEIDYDKIAAKVAAEIKPAEIDYDQLAKEVAKRLPPSPVSYDIRPRKQ